MRLSSVYCILFFPSAFSAFAEADGVLLGDYPAEIVPEQARIFSAKETGRITELIDVSGRIPRDTIIACLNREEIDQKQREIEIELIRDSLTKRDEIQKLEEQKAELKFYLSLPLAQRKYETQPGDEPPTEETLKEIDERIDLARREKESTEKRKKMDFDKLRDSYIIRMPFNGRVQYNFTIPEDPDAPLEIEAGQSFITVCDDSAFYITLALGQTEMTQLPPEKMSVTVALSEGKTLSGVFSHRRVEPDRSGRNTQLMYSFRIPVQDHELAYSLISSKCMAQLFYAVDGETLVVKKDELNLSPRAAAAQSWGRLAEEVYPEYVVVVVAADSIVMRKK